MLLLALGRWTGREWRRSATAWLLLLGPMLVGPICLLSLPWNIVGDGYSNAVYCGPIWYLSSYSGALVGILLMAHAGTIWWELGPLRQVWLALVVLTACALFYGCAAACTLLALGSAWVADWWPALLCTAHWSALGAFVQRTSLGLGAKCFLLSSLGWWIPALVGTAPGWNRLHWLLGPGNHLGLKAVPSETPLGVFVDTIPIFAWWVAAALLPTRSAFRR